MDGLVRNLREVGSSLRHEGVRRAGVPRERMAEESRRIVGVPRLSAPTRTNLLGRVAQRTGGAEMKEKQANDRTPDQYPEWLRKAASLGGQRSRRKLTKKQAREMVKARERKRKESQ